MFAFSTALLFILCANTTLAQTIRRRRSSGGIIGGIIAVVFFVLILCCCFVMFRRRRAMNARTSATGTGKPLFGGPWRRQQPAPVNGPTFGNGYGNVAVPPPTYVRDGGYTAYPAV